MGGLAPSAAPAGCGAISTATAATAATAATTSATATASSIALQLHVIPSSLQILRHAGCHQRRGLVQPQAKRLAVVRVAGQSVEHCAGLVHHCTNACVLHERVHQTVQR
ncbi:MAG: hypothetical protein ACK4NM_19245, partial [Hydrogenophaga sp.]